MAIFYVNSITGNNSNNGSTWALAKATLAGANTAASAGDTIYVHGIFNEAIPGTKVLTWIGVGLAKLDGGGSVAGPTPSVAINVANLIFANFTTAYDSRNSAPGAYFINCIFQSGAFGLRFGNGSGRITCDNCAFLNYTTAAIAGNGSTMVGLLRNCAFSGNTISLSDGGNGGTIQVNRCVFRDAIMWSGAATFINADSNDNVYDFSVGKCVIGGVDKTTLASYIAAITAPRDSRSIDSVWSANVGDYANGVLRPNPASSLLTAGVGGVPLGLSVPGLTVSNNKNASLWTNGVFSNTEVDGSGNVVLSAGQTTGTFKTDVIDFGAAINAKLLEITLSGESGIANALPYVDYDTGESPGYYNVRVRGSNSSFAKGDASPSWVVVPRRAQIGDYMSNALRYWQIELTLRA